MVALEERVVGPVRRRARRTGVGIGRVTAWLSLVIGFFNLLAGSLFKLLSEGWFLDTVGVVLLVCGVLASVFGGGMLWAMGRWSRSGDAREIEGYLHRMLAQRASVDAAAAAHALELPQAAVEACARQMAHRGELERDFDTERGVEVYRAPGGLGAGEDALLERPERHDLDDFDRALDNARVSGQSRADSRPGAQAQPRAPGPSQPPADANAPLLEETRHEEEAVAAPRRKS